MQATRIGSHREIEEGKKFATRATGVSIGLVVGVIVFGQTDLASVWVGPGLLLSAGLGFGIANVIYHS